MSYQVQCQYCVFLPYFAVFGVDVDAWSSTNGFLGMEKYFCGQELEKNYRVIVD